MSRSETGPDPDEDGNDDLADFESTLSSLSNADLLAALDLTLVELERRLLTYATTGPEILQMADEGVVLAVRTIARLAQTQSAATHAQSHLQVLAVGGWRPQQTGRLSWRGDPRVTGEHE